MKKIPNTFYYTSIVLLLIGMLPMPYMFYFPMRAISSVCFIWCALISRKERAFSKTFLYALFSVLLNPILSLSLGKGIWMATDLIGALILFRDRKELIRDYQ